MLKPYIKKLLTGSFTTSYSKNPVFRPYTIHPTIADISFDFIVPDTESMGWYDVSYEKIPSELQLIKAITRPGFHVLEIGVHNGFHAAMFSRLLDRSEGKYHGIELMPNCYLAALAQLKLNETGPNFRLMQAAAGNKEGIVFFNDIDSGNGSVRPDGEGVRVQQIAADSLLDYFDKKVDLLKIDVEGYEAFVLAGCRNILAGYPNIALELHFSAWKGFDTDIQKVFQHIDLDQYHAVYFCNPNSGKINGLPQPEKIRIFHPGNLPDVDNMNVFFLSKKYFENIPSGLLEGES